VTPRPVELDEEAAAEIEDAARWYGERDAALPGRLLAELEGAVSALAERPRAFPRVLGLPTRVEVRRARLRRFPYALIITETPGAVRVIALAHLRRRPLYWAGRLPS
jgi:plasmid stabilization system protein ParE